MRRLGSRPLRQRHDRYGYGVAVLPVQLSGSHRSLRVQSPQCRLCLSATFLSYLWIGDRSPSIPLFFITGAEWSVNGSRDPFDFRVTGELLHDSFKPRKPIPEKNHRHQA
jgi:hypothetical protein